MTNGLSDADVTKIIELYHKGVPVQIITYREIDASPRKIEQKIKELHRLGVLPYRKKCKKEAV